MIECEQCKNKQARFEVEVFERWSDGNIIRSHKSVCEDCIGKLKINREGEINFIKV